MSHQAVTWALYSAPMLLTDAGRPDSAARQVLCVLAEHASEQGTGAYPSPVRMSWATGLDERTIERALRRLERGGLIARDGVGRNGCTRWKLSLSMVRPQSDLDDLEAAAAETRQVESARRQARRNRKSVDVSGTQNAGQTTAGTPLGCDNDRCVRHGKCGCPARRMPDVRHGAPPEPSVEPSENRQSGGSTTPRPPRPDAPPSSGHRNDHQKTITKGETNPVPPSSTTHAARASPTRCGHGIRIRLRPDGTSNCALCRRDPSAHDPPPNNVIPFPRPA